MHCSLQLKYTQINFQHLPTALSFGTCHHRKECPWNHWPLAPGFSPAVDDDQLFGFIALSPEVLIEQGVKRLPSNAPFKQKSRCTTQITCSEKTPDAMTNLERTTLLARTPGKNGMNHQVC